MAKTRISLLIILGVVLMPGLLAASTLTFGSTKKESANRVTMLETNPEISPQTLRRVLLMVMEHHPHFNYGTLRSGYQSGRLTIEKTVHPSAGDLYTVTYDGLEICVLMPI